MQTKLNHKTIPMPARYLINAVLIALFLFGGNAFVGSGAVLAQCVAVEAGSVIGAGSVVTVSLTEPGIYAGNPARLINKKK